MHYLQEHQTTAIGSPHHRSAIFHFAAFAVGQKLLIKANEDINKGLQSLEKLLGIEGRTDVEKVVWWADLGKTPAWPALVAKAEKTILVENFVAQLHSPPTDAPR